MTQDTKTKEHTVKVGCDYGNGKRVKQIGKVGGDTKSALVPVQFEDGTYGVVWDVAGGYQSLLVSDVNDWNELLAKSEAMPTAGRGIGSDVLHIGVTEGGKSVLLKFYFNEKANYRNDSIHRD